MTTSIYYLREAIPAILGPSVTGGDRRGPAAALDPVEAALASDLTEASTAGGFDVVAQLAESGRHAGWGVYRTSSGSIRVRSGKVSK